MSRELGVSIGRSSRPLSFILGAGCSLSSGAPTTTKVHTTLLSATSARFEHLDVRDVLHHLPEAEKQDILGPLFRSVKPAAGYHAIASLGKIRRVTVLNLNWDTALRQACRNLGTPHVCEDIRTFSGEPGLDDGVGVVDLHVHGIVGQECRYGRVETLAFSPGEQEWLLANGLDNLTVTIGASLAYETDFALLFDAWSASRERTRPRASQWFFLRAPADEHRGEERLRQATVRAQPFTYVSAAEVDFDVVTTLMVDSAFGYLAMAHETMDG